MAHVCFVSQRYYPGDARLYTEISSLQDAGYSVDVICMKGRDDSFTTLADGVRMYRIPAMTRRRASKVRYVAEYISFLVPTFFLLTLLHIVRGYRLVHVTNLPDGLLFSALIPKLLGAKIIFDVRECTPEMFMDRFGGGEGSKVIKVMTWIEQLCLRFADMTVTCTEPMRKALISRGGDPNKIDVILNVSVVHTRRAPTLPDPEAPIDGHLRVVTHGSIIRRYGHDVLIDAMVHVTKELPDARLEIMGDGPWVGDLKAQVKRLGLENVVTFAGFLPHNDLIDRLMSAHIGAVTLVKNPESDLVHTFKMYEYMQLGIPMVISRTTGVASYFSDDTMAFFEPGNARDLADAIIDLARDPNRRYRLAKNALQAYNEHSPARQKAEYLRIVRQVLRPEYSSVTSEVPRG